ncbi:MAG: transcriptional regulator NrdR [Clostridia bacterium]|nr:transcriptional regulator NrdR [Clostridia bacterium]
MKCPYCGVADSKVVDSRPSEDLQKIRRRRECISCGKRFTTYEIVETPPIIVIKRDKSRQVFDRNKLLGGMLRACVKRPVPVDVLESAITEIEAELAGQPEREVPSVRIGEMALEKLRGIDEIAYVRFASVYRDFKDISSFLEEIRAIGIE